MHDVDNLTVPALSGSSRLQERLFYCKTLELFCRCRTSGRTSGFRQETRIYLRYCLCGLWVDVLIELTY